MLLVNSVFKGLAVYSFFTLSLSPMYCSFPPAALESRRIQHKMREQE
jgi:hypothetical protein